MRRESVAGWALVCVREPAGGQSASRSPITPGAAWYLYLERSGRGRAWDPPDVRILQQAAARRDVARRPPRSRGPSSNPVAFRAVDGVATYPRRARGVRVLEVSDSFSPVEETVSLHERWSRRPTSPGEPPA